jgi:ribonuclease P protein subunit POP4
MNELLRGELIGLFVEVVDAKNKALVGIKGKVVDETRNMLKVGEKELIKDQVVLEVEYKGEKIRVEGRRLVGRPEERLKKVKK